MSSSVEGDNDSIYCEDLDQSNHVEHQGSAYSRGLIDAT